MPASLRFVAALLGAAALAAAASLLVQRQETKHADAAAATAMTHGGDPEAGRIAFRTYGCGACHEVKGQLAQDGQTGPSLDKVGARAFLAGRLANQPDQMIRWIRHPQSVEPGNGMPDMGVGETDARDIAAYLYTLN